MQDQLHTFDLSSDDELIKLWEIHRASWALLQEQKSRFSISYLPVHLFHQLRDERMALTALEAEFKRRNIQLPTGIDAPNPILNQPLINQLRAPLADFSGRTADMAHIIGLLHQPVERRIHAIFVRGMGGLGKTELVIQAAHHVLQLYPDGILFVDLRATVPQEFRSVIDGLRDVLRLFIDPPMVPTDLHTLTTLYRQMLAGKRMLILLDDVPDAITLTHMQPPDGCTLVATMRPKLYLDGAAVIDLAEFPLDDARRLVRQMVPAIADDPDLDSLIMRCGRLPLALRIAAATLRERYPMMSIARYIARLNTLPIRLDGRDVRTILGASSMLLAQDKPDLVQRWRMLHVCPSAFTTAIAAGVWSDRRLDQVEDDLFALCYYSLLSVDTATGYYDLYTLLRDVAWSQCDVTERSVASLQHAQAIVGHVQTVLPLLQQGHETTFLALAQMETIWPHLETAIRWANQQIDHDPSVASLCLALTLNSRSLIDLQISANQALEWAIAAAHAAEVQGDQHARGQALRWQGNLLRELGDSEAALVIYTECLELAQQTRDVQLEGQVLGNLGSTYREHGRFGEARAAFTASLAIAQQLNDQAAIGKAEGRLSTIAYWEGDTEAAITGQEARLAIAQRRSDQREEGKAWGNLGLAYAAAQHPQAAAAFERSIAIARELGDRYTEARGCWNYGEYLVNQGKYTQARQFMHVYLDYAQLLGHPQAVHDAAYVAMLPAVDEQADDHSVVWGQEIMLRSDQKKLRI